METKTESKIFQLQHVALYTKNWYQRTDDVWEDIKKCLIGDGYFDKFYQGGKGDILAIVIRHVAPLFTQSIKDFAHEMVFEVNEERCWRFGYEHSGLTWLKDRSYYSKLKPYDQKEASLWFFLSKLQNTTLIELGDVICPPDSNVLSLRRDAEPVEKKETA